MFWSSRERRGCYFSFLTEREVGYTHKFSLDLQNNITDIQALIHCNSTSFLRHSAIPFLRGISSYCPGGNILTAEQRSNLHCAARSESEQLLLQVLSGSQTEMERNPGIKGPEQIPQKVQIQDLCCILFTRATGWRIHISKFLCIHHTGNI